MAIKRTSSDCGMMTPEDARRLLRHIVPDKQRRFREHHKNHLLAIMRAGDYLEGAVRIAAMPDKSRRLADGQHSVAALAEHDAPIFFHQTTYRCDAEVDYRRLFHAFDTENLKRSHKDCAAAFMQTGAVNGSPISDRLFNNFRGGVMLAAEYGSIDIEDCVTKFDEFEAACVYGEEVKFIAELDAIKIRRELLDRQAVCASIIVTHSLWPNYAKPFWRQVATGFFTEQDSRNPIVQLHRFLLDIKQMAGGNKNRKSYGGITYSKWEAFKAVQICWNNWGSGRPMGTLRVRGDGGLPGFNEPKIAVPKFTQEQANAASARNG